MGKPAQQRKVFIREWRQARGLSQQALGDKIGRGKSAVKKMEDGDNNLIIENLWNIADALECSIHDLLGRPPGEYSNLFTTFELATPDERDQIERLAQAIVKPKETPPARKFPNRK